MLILRDVKQGREISTNYIAILLTAGQEGMTSAGITKEDPLFCDSHASHPHTTSVTFAEEDAGPCLSIITAYNKA